MNGEILQARLYAGYAKAAARTGRLYSQYRATSPVTPIDSGNLLGTIDCLFSAEQNFQSPSKYKIPTRYLYADGTLLQQRDILVGPYGTFFIGDMQPNLPIQSIRCNDVIKIERPAYDGITYAPIQIAFELPIFRQLKKTDIKHPEFSSNTSGTAIAEYFGFLPVEVGTVEQHDIVTDQEGKVYELNTVDNTEIGVVITFRQSEA